MPTSTWVHVSDVMEIVIESRAKSLLDVGCGWGRWGVLFRDMLDIIEARWFPAEWKARIEAIEPTLAYITPIHYTVYDAIHPVLAQTWLKTDQRHFEIVWVGDMLEHISPEESMDVANQLIDRATKLFIAGVPVGDDWPQGAVNGNENEVHRTPWTEQMIKGVATAYKFYPMESRRYALFVVEKPGTHAHFPGAIRPAHE